MRRTLRQLLCGVLPILFLAACGEDPAEPDDDAKLDDVVAEVNPHNALSTWVHFDAENLIEARVVYISDTGEPEFTPYYPITDGRARIATLGLKPATQYLHRVEARTPAGDVTSETVAASTGEAPAFLAQSVRLEVTGATTPPGFTLTSLLTRSDPDEHFAVAFDGTGTLRWYHQLDGPTSFVRQQPNDNMTAFIGTTTGFQPTYGYFIEFEPGGTFVRRHQAPPPLYTDNHELLLGADGTAHLFSYDIRRTDLSPIGGFSDVLLAGHQILRFGAGGSVEFMWNAWDHFVIEDWIEEPRVQINRTQCDWDHPNSLELDQDGNYIASFRHLAEISKIDARTGTVLWRFGGRNNQFQILDDPLQGFNGQHSARILDNGNLLLYDNGLRHDPPESRAVEYAVDPTTLQARMVWQFRHDPMIFTQFVGSAQRLGNGNTLVGFAQAGIATEVTMAGDVVWEATFKIDDVATAVYRFDRIVSLYEYAKP